MLRKSAKENRLTIDEVENLVGLIDDSIANREQEQEDKQHGYLSAAKQQEIPFYDPDIIDVDYMPST